MEYKKNHRLDLSGVQKDAISEASILRIEEIIQQASIEEGGLSLIGLSCKKNVMGGLEITLLVSNGTRENLQIQQFPLNVYDAKNDLVAQGTFQFADYMIYANTTKPLTIVFPKAGIIHETMDLTSWTVEMAK